ncbi:MAG: glycosyltransferase [Cyanobacteria bacterium P01_A01_bin.84]
MSKVGVVVIGRNEGNRLKSCLLSVLGENRVIVYVDSGSTDKSVELANSLGVNVVELNLSVPFTAARARNQGFEYLLKIEPDIEFVQFVDGDCRILQEWWSPATQELQIQPNVVVVCGRRQEQFPEKSIYNRLCDIEWDTPIGEAKACGGDAMMRVAALQQVGGFNPKLIAGEEPELCLRLRQAGGKIMRIDAPMTIHDAQMTNFPQWWKRSLRAGHAYAEGSWLHGKTPEKYWVKESHSIWIYGFILPTLAVVLMLPSYGLSIVFLVAVYAYLGYRVYSFAKSQELSSSDAILYSLFCIIGKFPQAQGQIQFHLGKLLQRQSKLVEYKKVVS